MQLMTKEIKQKLPPLGTDDPDASVVFKLFAPWTNWTWYVTEGDAEGDDYRLFGLVDGFEKELGYFMLSELEMVTGPMGLKIERDRGYTAKLSDLMGAAS